MASGPRNLASDLNVVPARGSLLRVVNNGKGFEKTTLAMGVDNAELTNYNILFHCPED